MRTKSLRINKNKFIYNVCRVLLCKVNTSISFVTNKLSCSYYHLNDNPWLKVNLYTCIFYLINITM